MILEQKTITEWSDDGYGRMDKLIDIVMKLWACLSKAKKQKGWLTYL